MAFILKADEKVALAVVFTDAFGNMAVVDGTPVWESTNPAVIDVVVGVDGLSAEAVTVGPAGMAQVSVRADADLGAGIVEIIGVLDVEVVAADAELVVINAGAPEPRI